MHRTSSRAVALSAGRYPAWMRRLFLAVTAVAIVLAVPNSAGAVAGGRYAIGDSVMLGAKTQLQNRGFVVNAKGSRQFSEAVTIVKQKAASGVLRRKVI